MIFLGCKMDSKPDYSSQVLTCKFTIMLFFKRKKGEKKLRGKKVKIV